MTLWQKVVNGMRLEAETITGAAILIAGFGLASRVLGLIRDRILAGMFGASGLDIYYAAFQVPDLLYSLLVVGAISTAFIPVFAGYFERDKAEAWRVASGVFSLFAIVFSVLALLAILFAPLFMRFVVPGFSSERRTVAVELTRIMFLSPVFFGLANVLASALQYFRRFFMVSAAPVLYNLGIIFGAMVLTPVLGPAGLAWGVVLGAVSFFALHLVGVAGLGFRFWDLASMFHVGVRRIIVQALPRTVGLAFGQIVQVVVAAIASTFAAGSIGVYNLAFNLQSVPIGLVGVAFASAAFPKLSRAWAEGNSAKFRTTLSYTLREILFFLVPFAVLLIILRAQIVRLFYGLGKFGWVDTRLTAAVLGLFAASIVAQGVIPLLARAFYSRHKTAVPVGVGMAAVVLTVLFAGAFIPVLSGSNSLAALLRVGDLADTRVLALALAFSLASFFNAIALYLFAVREVKDGFHREVAPTFLKMLVAASALAFAAYGALRVLAEVVNMHSTVGVFAQGVGAAVAGAAAYTIVSYLLGCREMMILAPVVRRLAFWRKFLPAAIREEEDLR